LTQKRRKFSPEFRDEAVKMVIETSRPISDVARDLGILEGTLGSWVATYRHAHTKLIKRQMYGRAGFPLLRHRILLG
jgi:transposase-like protein